MAIPIPISVKLSDVTGSGKTKIASSKHPKCVSQFLHKISMKFAMLYNQTGRNWKSKVENPRWWPINFQNVYLSLYTS